MGDQSNEKLAELSINCKALRDNSKTLLLSTLGKESHPEISYAPYALDDKGRFFVFISELAAHTQNLMLQAKASVMFIADEEKTQNIFARERLVLKCDALEIETHEAEYVVMLDKLEERFGNIVGMLRGLADFRLFCLTPADGHYVVGFGKAYKVDTVTGELAHISEDIVKRQRTE